MFHKEHFTHSEITAVILILRRLCLTAELILKCLLIDNNYFVFYNADAQS